MGLSPPRDGRHAILDGKVQLYLRSGSPNWQCACSVGGRQHRANTGEDGLTRAAAFAHDWYLSLANGEAIGSGRTTGQPVARPAPLTSRRGLRSAASAPRQTFREAASRFMVEFEALTQGQRNPIYVAGHRARLANHLIPFFGMMSVREIDAGVIAEYRVMRMGDRHRGTPPARSTLHQEIVCLRQVLKTAIRLRWIDHLPDLSAPYGRSGKISHRAWFSPEEWGLFEAALHDRVARPRKERWREAGENLRDYALIMINTGLRPDEALRLEYRDVAVISDGATGERILEIAVRGKRGVGWCKSMPEAVEPFSRLKERNAGQPLDRLFPAFQRELFNAILDELRMKTDREGRRRTAYSLRHTYICTRLMNGADIYQVAKNCRTSVEMIETYYAAHIKNVIDASAINVRKLRPSPSGASPAP
ncbi:integrase [Caulobacter flavus]|uniref:Integrase n=1 Tax=Caulobacter flavus TaxID=1679497 RepID=A0A2N5CZP8_9CAUL|nr:integrase [Caulobacter flavus]PLR19289.1 integrase [Caulobacter flavus]